MSLNRLVYKFLIPLICAIVSLHSAMAKSINYEINKPTQVLQRVTLPGTPYEVGMGLGEMAPNTMKNRRLQSGPEMVYVLKGELILTLEKQPAIVIKKGESFQIPAGAIHETKAGLHGAKFLATWVVEKDKRQQFVVPVNKS